MPELARSHDQRHTFMRHLNDIRQDRGEKLDFALAVENYVTHQRNIITRPKDADKLSVFEMQNETAREAVDPKDVVSEDTMLAIFLEPWVSIPEMTGQVWPTKKLTFSLPSWDVAVSDVPAASTHE
jgi:hypothetical protein